MEITEVRIKLLPTMDSNNKLRGFCSITIDGAFVIRDIKIIQGGQGDFVAMPSRRLEHHCPQCRHKNHLRAQFCNECGVRLSRPPTPTIGARERLFVDVAHPVNARARTSVHDAVMKEYAREVERSQRSGYRFARPEDFDESYRENCQSEGEH